MVEISFGLRVEDAADHYFLRIGKSFKPKVISILEFSRRLDGLFSAIKKAPFRSSDPTLASRSDLRYVPTLRTFLHYKCYFYSEIPGAQAPV